MYHSKGKESAKAAADLNLLATLTINIADYYRQMGNFEKALEIYIEGIGYAEQDTSGMARPKAYNNTAMVYGYLGDSYTELEYYFKAIEASNKPALEERIGLFYSNVAEVYTSLNEYEKALKYSLLGIEKSLRSKQTRILMASYEVLGNIYLGMDSLQLASQSFNESIRLNEEVKDKRMLARNLGNLGGIELRQKNYEKAIDFFKKGIRIQEELGDNKFKIKNLLGLTNTYLLMGNLAAASISNNETRQLATTLGIRNSLAESLKLSARILEKQGRMKEAIDLIKSYDSINTIIIGEERLKHLQNLERLQQAKVKEFENLELKRNMEQQAEVISRQDRLFRMSIALIVLLVIISFFIYSLFRKNQLAKQQITHQNQTLVNKNEEIQAMSDQQENLLHLVVHDLRSPLNKIEGLVNVLRLEGGLNKSQEELVGMMEGVAKKSKLYISELLETSQIQYRARQPKIAPFDLPLLLTEITEEYRPHATKKTIEVKCQFDLPNKPALSDRGLLYHIIINLLSNAIKYSPSNTQIQLKAWAEGSKLWIQIKDEGQGFTEADKRSLYQKFQKLSAKPIGAEPATGLGLYLTKILVDSLNGKIELESEEKKGSAFTLIFKDIF